MLKFNNSMAKRGVYYTHRCKRNTLYEPIGRTAHKVLVKCKDRRYGFTPYAAVCYFHRQSGLIVEIIWKAGKSENITPKQWRVEIQSLQVEYDSIGKEQSKTATEFAYVEAISYSKKKLERASEREPTTRQTTGQSEMEVGSNLM